LILSHRPLKGALFGSAFPPGDELEDLAKVLGSNMALFYQSYEVILSAPPLRMVWPDGILGSNIDRFRRFMEEAAAPAEKMHLKEFWKLLGEEREVTSDLFLLRSGILFDTSLLGIVFLGFSWGRFLVIIPGEDPSRVRDLASRLTDSPQKPLRSALNRWVEDLESEFVVTWLLEQFPEEFRSSSGFSRKLGVPLPENKMQVYDLYYAFRNRKWQRDVVEGEIVEGVTATGLSWKRPGGKAGSTTTGTPIVRERGIRVGGEVHIRFSVFVGGVYPLGEIPVPVSALAGGGLVRMNRFIREVSTALVSHSQSLTSSHFRFCRYWTESGFSLSGLEDIAKIVDPGNWRNLILLPFWETGPNSLSEVKTACRVSDPFFYDPAKNMGALLLRDCSEWHARNVVANHFRNRVRAHVETPITVGRFLSVQ